MDIVNISNIKNFISDELKDINIDKYPNFKIIIEKLIIATPDKKSQKAIIKNLNSHQSDDFMMIDELAFFILKLTSNKIDNYIESYKWMIDIFKEELINFIRTKKYRRSSFEETYRDIYSNEAYMKRYMEGLLISQVIWSNHSKSFINFYNFIKGQEKDFNYLEIGPGHGLYLALAAKSPKCISAETWDISRESIRQTKASIQRLEVTKKVSFKNCNILNNSLSKKTEIFNLIVISEVLEHLEKPQIALQNIKKLIAKDGILYINFPINSPSPDHIFLLKTVKEVELLIINAGFKIIESNSFPSSGYTMEEAIMRDATISCAIKAKMRKF